MVIDTLEGTTLWSPVHGEIRTTDGQGLELARRERETPLWIRVRLVVEFGEYTGREHTIPVWYVFKAHFTLVHHGDMNMDAGAERFMRDIVVGILLSLTSYSH